jgi:hypothetical protein
MTPATLDKFIWTLIYGGILSGLLGLASWSRDATVAAVLITVGVVVAAAGVLGIYLRSRMKE